MVGSWLQTYAADVAALLFNVALFIGYRVFRVRRVRRDPHASLQGQQAVVRATWVAEVLASGNGILGVQTLRNAMMGSVYFASNTMFLVMGTLSLTAQQHLSIAWALLDPGGPKSATLQQVKLVVLLLTLLVAFFCFISAIRLFEHASVSIGLKTSVAARVSEQINDAWGYQGLGVRCYYFAAPVLFWLSGAVWFALAGLAAIALMTVFDHPTQRTR